MKIIYFILACISSALGAIGVLLPVYQPYPSHYQPLRHFRKAQSDFINGLCLNASCIKNIWIALLEIGK